MGAIDPAVLATLVYVVYKFVRLRNRTRAERAANLQEQLQASVEMTKSLLFSSATIAATDFFALGGELR